jgi:hypothetical protein
VTRSYTVRVVAQRLGHSEAEKTLNTYAHMLPDTQQDTAAKLMPPRPATLPSDWDDVARRIQSSTRSFEAASFRSPTSLCSMVAPFTYWRIERSLPCVTMLSSARHGSDAQRPAIG